MASEPQSCPEFLGTSARKLNHTTASQSDRETAINPKMGGFDVIQIQDLPPIGTKECLRVELFSNALGMAGFLITNLE